MKITKSELKQIIKEEIESSKEILNLLSDISQKLNRGADILKAIESVDTSIDYLIAATTGENPLTIGAMQKSFGRFRAPPTQAPLSPPPPQVVTKEDE
jgi:dynactin complex subunit|tara:strand:+ start:1972 stop:2265 length:294 start_codon:yes stop_codon:yes gene_type:complete